MIVITHKVVLTFIEWSKCFYEDNGTWPDTFRWIDENGGWLSLSRRNVQMLHTALGHTCEKGAPSNHDDNPLQVQISKEINSLIDEHACVLRQSVPKHYYLRDVLHGVDSILEKVAAETGKPLVYHRPSVVVKIVDSYTAGVGAEACISSILSTVKFRRVHSFAALSTFTDEDFDRREMAYENMQLELVAGPRVPPKTEYIFDVLQTVQSCLEETDDPAGRFKNFNRPFVIKRAEAAHERGLRIASCVTDILSELTSTAAIEGNVALVGTGA